MPPQQNSPKMPGIHYGPIKTNKKKGIDSAIINVPGQKQAKPTAPFPMSRPDTLSGPLLDKSVSAKVELRIEGALYLDQKQSSRKLYANKGELPIRDYNSIHRIGRAILSTQDDTILLQSGNASYHYAAEDLDQIIFQDKGIALVPHSSKQPGAIFLSMEIARVKDHIKAYS